MALENVRVTLLSAPRGVTREVPVFTSFNEFINQFLTLLYGLFRQQAAKSPLIKSRVANGESVAKVHGTNLEPGRKRSILMIIACYSPSVF